MYQQPVFLHLIYTGIQDNKLKGAVTMKLAEMKKTHYINVNGEEIPYHKIDHDINGNKRYVVHFINLNVKLADYGKIKGLTKYRAKWFGGGYVFQAWNLEEELKYRLNLVENYYKDKRAV